MIPVGTLCYLTGDHSRAGQCCTIIAPLCVRNAQVDGVPFLDAHYLIELASKEPCCDAWAALPKHLIPITPPGLTDDVDQQIAVTA